jgi:chromosome segregation ATPase
MATNSALAVDVKKFETGLTRLQSEATSIVVKDAETCLVAKTMQRDVRTYIKDVKSKLSPFVEAAKTNYQKTKDELDRWVDPATRIDETLAAKVKDYEGQEREAAEAEQRRINEERRRVAAEQAEAERKEREQKAEEERKAREKEAEAARKSGEIGKREAERIKKEAAEAEQRANEQATRDAEEKAKNVVEVKVQPNIPAVAGVPSRRNWRYKIVDESKIPDRFWKLDEQYIGAEVRRIKDKQKAEAEIPGIECYQE